MLDGKPPPSKPSYHFNHSITQSLNHSITQSLNHSITQSLNHSITQSLNHSITQSLNHSITMCGRYSIGNDIQQIGQELNVTLPPAFTPRYNAAPSQALPVVSNAQRQHVSLYTWGIIPFWAKEKGQRLINARAETVAEKSTFKKSFRQRRCLVLADGYYEWKKTAEGKVPYRLVLHDRHPFVFAGIWDEHADQETGEVRNDFCIITTAASPGIAHIHDRMPVILSQEAWEFWLADTEDYAGLTDVLRPLEDGQIEAYEVSKRVNNVQNDDEDLTRLNSK